ncbi:uncharacterized peptidase C1-like protein F26E4.3 [Contarinia nasturtii]|uniref:uncharacterized peptidase C1-like protein F26E4.3 n=1 Tax=Contarinia nasturtii TaxID=265458 RepID=UPI0012D4654F|nr:uncharacterized peptidase C1-like protein F26E4.3 [Contarinia nasturtii]
MDWFRKLNILLGISVLLLGVILNANGQLGEFEGIPFCETRPGGCCKDRTDSCAVPISTTLCYCDEFCGSFSNDKSNRWPNGDCCPDYESFCLGIYPPQNITEVECMHKGQYFGPSNPIRDNCNLCSCQKSGHTVCEQNLCLIDDSLINNVNSITRTLGWTATNYTEFWGRKYDEGLELRLGTKEPTYKVKAMTKLTNKPESLPRNFNAVEDERWSSYISPIQDQGWCGASWAISTASVASDRFGIQTKGKESVELSPQQLLSCVRKQSGCNGGHLDWAWNYIRKIGLVDEDCFPYAGKPSHCKVKRTDTLSSAGCQLPTKVPRDHLYRVGPAYSLNNESDIMTEIQESGPVQATMRVYRDFFAYRGGIYRRSAASRDEKGGFHSVRLLGWGEERTGYETTKFWIAANSWGSWWGENGYFRILRGVNECEIESYVLATWPHAHLRPKKFKQSLKTSPNRRPFSRPFY